MSPIAYPRMIGDIANPFLWALGSERRLSAWPARRRTAPANSAWAPSPDWCDAAWVETERRPRDRASRFPYTADLEPGTAPRGHRQSTQPGGPTIDHHSHDPGSGGRVVIRRRTTGEPFGSSRTHLVWLWKRPAPMAAMLMGSFERSSSPCAHRHGNLAAYQLGQRHTELYWPRCTHTRNRPTPRTSS